MNKEEIENIKLGTSIPLLTQEEINGIDINMNEIINKFTKMVVREKDLVITQYIMQRQQEKIKKLEQKESILDKVTDKLKEVDKKYKNEYENIENMELSATKICVLQELSCVIEDIEEILSIIEGEKK